MHFWNTSAVLALLLACFTPLLDAGSLDQVEGKTAPHLRTQTEVDLRSNAEIALREDNWALWGTTGYLPNQEFTGTNRSYSIIPVQLSGTWVMDEIGNDNLLGGWLRGNTSMRFTPFYQVVAHGPETRFVGVMSGPMYHFVQKGWDLVPFVGAQVGVGFTDSRDALYSQGQDFAFTFQVNAGARYFFSPRWSTALELAYQHYSNAGLSEPARQNTGLDLFGPQVSVIYSF